jgi:hypothetical protein
VRNVAVRGADADATGADAPTARADAAARADPRADPDSAARDDAPCDPAADVVVTACDADAQRSRRPVGR